MIEILFLKTNHAPNLVTICLIATYVHVMNAQIFQCSCLSKQSLIHRLGICAITTYIFIIKYMAHVLWYVMAIYFQLLNFVSPFDLQAEEKVLKKVRRKIKNKVNCDLICYIYDCCHDQWLK